jgi:AmmeMemoRadiSam system protein B
VQIPFLQKVLKDFKIVPIATLQKTADDARELASSIVECCKGREWLLLATSDLYHGNSYEECVATSETTVENIMKGDPDEMEGSFASGRSSACGEGVILTALSGARLLDASPVLLHQTNSGDVMGSRTGYVVGYCSIAFT